MRQRNEGCVRIAIYFSIFLFTETKLEDSGHRIEQTSTEDKASLENNTIMDDLTPEPLEVINDPTANLSPCDMEISSPD